MNKKCASYIIIAILCFSLLTPTSNAFVLNEPKTDVIFNGYTEENENWIDFYLPIAKVLKIVPQKTTMLDLAKAAERDNGRMISYIINRTHYEREKLVVKWERDNGYIDEEVEKDFKITPAIRLQLLAEIREEEESEKKGNRNFVFKVGKAPLKIISFGITFGGTMFLNKNVKGANKWEIALKWATIGTLFVITAIEAIESYCEWSWDKMKRIWKVKDDEEIDTGNPRIRTKEDIVKLPSLPENYERVDVYKSL